MTKIYHNPRCSKSRSTLKILEEHGVTPEIVEYLKTNPDIGEIKSLVKMLGIAPVELIRKGEKVFKEHYKGKDLSDEEWISAMAEHPVLIERPIVVKDGKAIIGRPPEKVIELL